MSLFPWRCIVCRKWQWLGNSCSDCARKAFRMMFVRFCEAMEKGREAALVEHQRKAQASVELN